jgi:hypothetical protein
MHGTGVHLNLLDFLEKMIVGLPARSRVVREAAYDVFFAASGFSRRWSPSKAVKS